MKTIKRFMDNLFNKTGILSMPYKLKKHDLSEDNHAFYHNIDEVTDVCIDAQKHETVPNIIHRLLLYDADFPNNLKGTIRKFEKLNNDFHHVLWSEKDILSIMNSKEIEIYKIYPKKIQKSDYARYIALKYFGGIYCDLDVEALKPFITLYEKYKKDDLFFEECTISEDFIQETTSHKIRKGVPECALRISNYIIMARPNSRHINNIINICENRRLLPINEDYDVLYTTGPDVVSTYVDTILKSGSNAVQFLNKPDSDKYLRHLCDGHWRTGARTGNKCCR